MRKSNNSNENVLSIHRKGVFLIGATMLVPCQVRSKTESPCPHRAVVEIRGVDFCGSCAREQEAYFAIGELTKDERHGLRSKPLAGALERVRQEQRACGTEGIAVGKHHRFSGVEETGPLALTKG
jgi:predicted Fe-S protein YdhL (DUF1289 family)